MQDCTTAGSVCAHFMDTVIVRRIECSWQLSQRKFTQEIGSKRMDMYVQTGYR